MLLRFLGTTQQADGRGPAGSQRRCVGPVPCSNETSRCVASGSARAARPAVEARNLLLDLGDDVTHGVISLGHLVGQAQERDLTGESLEFGIFVDQNRLGELRGAGDHGVCERQAIDPRPVPEA